MKFRRGRRLWFSGRMRPCQGRDGSSILPSRTDTSLVTWPYSPHSLMDRVPVFGTGDAGSIPAGGTFVTPNMATRCKHKTK